MCDNNTSKPNVCTAYRSQVCLKIPALLIFASHQAIQYSEMGNGGSESLKSLFFFPSSKKNKKIKSYERRKQEEEKKISVSSLSPPCLPMSQLFPLPISWSTQSCTDTRTVLAFELKTIAHL